MNKTHQMDFEPPFGWCLGKGSRCQLFGRRHFEKAMPQMSLCFLHSCQPGRQLYNQMGFPLSCWQFVVLFGLPCITLASACSRKGKHGFAICQGRKLSEHRKAGPLWVFACSRIHCTSLLLKRPLRVMTMDSNAYELWLSPKHLKHPRGPAPLVRVAVADVLVYLGK